MRSGRLGWPRGRAPWGWGMAVPAARPCHRSHRRLACTVLARSCLAPRPAVAPGRTAATQCPHLLPAHEQQQQEGSITSPRRCRQQQRVGDAQTPPSLCGCRQGDQRERWGRARGQRLPHPVAPRGVGDRCHFLPGQRMTAVPRGLPGAQLPARCLRSRQRKAAAPSRVSAASSSSPAPARHRHGPARPGLRGPCQPPCAQEGQGPALGSTRLPGGKFG